jgi:hypothetical protein
MDVAGIVGEPDRLSKVVGTDNGTVVVVEVEQYGAPEKAVEALGALGTGNVVVILPKAWEGEDERFKALPNLVAGFTKPVSWPEVAGSVRGRLRERPEPDRVSAIDQQDGSLGERAGLPNVESYRSRVEKSRKLHVRLGFYGARGGVGASSAALLAAQVLADADYRVAVFDATGRGDLHVMMGHRPDGTSLVVRSGRVKLFLRRPDEDAVRDFDAVVIDGGREQGAFNADWVEVTRPLDEGEVRRLANLASVEERGFCGRRLPLDVGLDALNLGRVISVEVTE